jgi:hypothetical protein
LPLSLLLSRQRSSRHPPFGVDRCEQLFSSSADGLWMTAFGGIHECIPRI